ncbi:MAG: class B sortase [Clostridiales Family XIII bacterium]|jgi:sortase B|nr:class B sortase [Clostridiales Family XIII bacterium]
MKEKSRQKILIVITVICAITFLISSFFLLRHYLEGRRSEKGFEVLRLPEKEQSDYEKRLPHYQELKAQNADFVGWLYFYDTTIDYPVMHTPDDFEYYLRRNFEKEYDYAGCLFASDISDIEKPSDMVIVYGHDMLNRTMFGTLQKLKDETYYETHKYLYFDTLQERRSYEICAIVQTEVNTGRADEFFYYDVSDFHNQAQFDEFINQIRAKQYFDTGVQMTFGENYMLFSTCEDTADNKRLVVLAKQISNDDPNLVTQITSLMSQQ